VPILSGDRPRVTQTLKLQQQSIDGIACMNEKEKLIALDLIYQGCELEKNRFTTDFPITSEVWLLFANGRHFNRPKSILLTPHIEAGMTGLRAAVTQLLPVLSGSSEKQVSTVDRFWLAQGSPGPARSPRYIAANESHLLVHIDFYELLALLPLTRWWQQYIASAIRFDPSTIYTVKSAVDWLLNDTVAQQLVDHVLEHVQDEEAIRSFSRIGPLLAESWLDAQTSAQRAAIARLLNIAALQVALSLLGWSRRVDANLEQYVKLLAGRVLLVIARCFANYLDRTEMHEGHISPLWQVSCNRPAEQAIVASRKTIKADAAVRVFDTGGKGIRWAVIDSGIDARHPGLARPSELTPGANLTNGLCLPSVSRVIKTLDFTRLVAITSGRVPRALMALLTRRYGSIEAAQNRIEAIRADLANGRMLDWTAVEPLLEIDHSDYQRYIPPPDSHGTHVAGVIGANWHSDTYRKAAPVDSEEHQDGIEDPELRVPAELVRYQSISGICPDIELLDLRVFNEDGDSDEFAILGALQYIRFLNQSKDRQYVHGVNLSLSLRHDVRNYACGSTPVCLECDRLVGAGIVVVAAAGNFGYDRNYAELNLGGAYRGQSITDPGNAASVITVGATHRSDPYQYGVSYFSSRGPTGDGRSKPDLVAPGEKIMSTVRDGTIASMDGTSMAAPHVSGAAALLLSRNNELMGKPTLIKQILCNSASDLGRERAFQGAGLLDTLRALQSV
jgi:serine protease AprX